MKKLGILLAAAILTVLTAISLILYLAVTKSEDIKL